MDLTVRVVIDESPAMVTSLAALTEALQNIAACNVLCQDGPVTTHNTTVVQNNNPAQVVPAAVPASPAVRDARVVPVNQMPAAPVIPVTAPAAPMMQATPVNIPAAPAIPTAAVKQYTLGEIQAACAPLMDAGKMQALATLIQGFGVPSLQQIPPEKYGELVIQLRAMGARL